MNIDSQEHIPSRIKGNKMELGTLLEGCQRKCECKNGSFITSNYRIISLPNFCNNKFVRSIALKLGTHNKINLRDFLY